MRFLKLAQKNKEINPSSWETLYEHLIIKAVRKRYTVNQELAILRQRDTKPNEFEQYNAYVEECKQKVKKELGMIN